MLRRRILAPGLRLSELAAFHEDVTNSLRLYFSPEAPTFTARFAGKTQSEVENLLASRLTESDIRSTLAVLTSLEAAFRMDFDRRCQDRLKDGLSRYFRGVKKTRNKWVRLDEDILEGWRLHGAVAAGSIGEVRGLLKLRHWLAHGQHWEPKLARRKYDFEYVHVIAEGVIARFGFVA
jgi:hypothetical protein